MGSIPPHVRVYDFQSKKTFFAFFQLWRVIDKTKPDIVFAMGGNFSLAILLLKLFGMIRSRTIVREQTVRSIRVKGESFYWISYALYQLLFRRADLVICQSKKMLDDLRDSFSVPPARLVHIYNPLDMETVQQKAKGENNPYLGIEGVHICSAGRLSPPKRFDRVIRAFKDLKLSGPSHLWIVGEGPLMGELKKLRDGLNLEDRVHFTGFQENPYKWFYHADLFVMASDYDGLPNVLLEALACGCPVLAVDCPGGTREIMELTGNADYLMAELEIRGEHLTRKKGVPAGLIENFNVRKIVKKYRDLLLEE